MAFYNPTNGYARTSDWQIRTRLALMLLDGTINALEGTLMAFRTGSTEELTRRFRENLTTARSLLRELRELMSRDFESTVAGMLSEFWNYSEFRLEESLARGTTDGVKDVLNNLIRIRQAWREAIGLRAES